jgi:hypothetical protein
MDKRFFLALFLSLIVIAVSQLLFPPPKPAPGSRNTAVKDSVSAVTAPRETASSTPRVVAERPVITPSSVQAAPSAPNSVPLATAEITEVSTPKAIYKFGASNDELQQLRGSNLVIWEAIKWLVRNRFTELTFGRTSMANEGLRRFKLGWGTEEYRISYSKYDFRQSQFVPDTDRASGWYNRVFALMPISLARCAGVLLYPHLV